MSTKREDLINSGLEEGKKVEIEDIIEGDTITLNKEDGSAKEALHKVNKEIKSLVKNPEFSLGSDLISLYSKKDDIEKRISAIASIKKDFLS